MGKYAFFFFVLPLFLLPAGAQENTSPASPPATLVQSAKMAGVPTQIKWHGTVRLDMATELHGGAQAGWRENGLYASPDSIWLDREGGRSNGMQMGLTAAGSSFGFTATTPSPFGAVRTHLNMDCKGRGWQRGHGSTLRLRNAYFTLGDTLSLGLRNSLFFDANAEPMCLQGAEPSLGGGRAPQVRVMQKFGKGMLSFSLEDTQSSPGLTRAWNIYSLVGRWDHTLPFGTVSFRLAGTHFKNARVQGMGWGAAVGAGIKLGEQDRLTLNAAGGSGMGDFMWGMMGRHPQVAVHDLKNHRLHFWKSVGVSLGYQHHWNKQWHSSVVGHGVWVGHNQNIWEAIAYNQHQYSAAKHAYEAPYKFTGKDGKLHVLKAYPHEPPVPYDWHNRFFYCLGVNTLWEPTSYLTFGAEVNCNFRRIFQGDTGREMNVGLSAMCRVF